MKSLAVCIARNAGDFIALAVLHHLLTGVDHCIVVDNGSSDATSDILKAISRKMPRLTVIHDPSPFDQAKLRNDAIREFVTREKTILIPFDSDELWALSVRELARTFARLNANVLRCKVDNFVQARSVLRPSRWSWIRACRRASIIEGDPATLVQERKGSFVEAPFPSKIVLIAKGDVFIGKGAHVVRFDGMRERPADFSCLHLPLRSRAELAVRANDYEPRRAPFRVGERDSWQSRYWRETVVRGEEELEWHANSYDRRGYLDVYGRKAKTFLDFRMVRLLGRAYAYGLYLNVPMFPRV